jgi:2-haloacid dehalogenase
MSLFVFDAYGTLFDVHAAIRRFSTGPDADHMSEIWRAKQLEYSWTLTLAGRYADFWTLTGRAAAGSSCPSTNRSSMPSTSRLARSRAAIRKPARTIITQRESSCRYASQNTPPESVNSKAVRLTVCGGTHCPC